MANVDDLAIREALLHDQITWEQALEALTSRGKPWATTAWKQQRDALIRNRCE